MTTGLYVALYYIFFLLVTLVVSKWSWHGRMVQENGSKWSISLVLLVLLVFTYRDIDSKYFGDTVAYYRMYRNVCKYGFSEILDYKDYGYAILTYMCSYFRSVQAYFFIVAFLYILPVYYVFRQNYSSNYVVALLLFICSFSFFGYGTNGLRNGIATSLCIFAFYSPRIVVQVVVLVIAFYMHKSAALPILAFLLTWRYNNPKYYFWIWGVVFLLVLFGGNALVGNISNYDFFETDTRLHDYSTGFDQLEREVGFSSTGFRWDFVLYSTIPMVLGYIYVFKYKFQDIFYNRLLCTYILCNAFWLIYIYQPYNNRFAYLSWFLYPIIIAHPLLRQKNLVPNQKLKERYIILGNELFTFIMFLINQSKM